MSYCENTPDGVRLRVRVVPRAARSEIAEIREHDLRIRLQASPVDNKANRALTTFLADTFGLSKRDVHLVSGATSRDKEVLLRGLTAPQLRARLQNPDPGK